MRQAVMIQPGKIELNEVEEPVAGPGEILLRVKKRSRRASVMNGLMWLLRPLGLKPRSTMLCRTFKKAVT